MHHPQTAPALLRITLTAALLVIPGLAWSQTPSQSPAQAQPPPGLSPSGTQPGLTAPTPAMPGATMPGLTSSVTPGATLNPPATAAMAGSVIATRPRMSQLIGSRIYNDRDQNVGEVDDVLLTPNGPMAIVQVGGFLGIGGRLVQMPLSDMRWNAERERLMLPGATKEMLETRPAFEYDPAHRRR